LAVVITDVKKSYVCVLCSGGQSRHTIPVPRWARLPDSQDTIAYQLADGPEDKYEDIVEGQVFTADPSDVPATCPECDRVIQDNERITDKHWRTSKSIVYSRRRAIMIMVRQWYCDAENMNGACTGTHPFDGDEHRLFYYYKNAKYGPLMFSHHIINDFSKRLSTTFQTTFHSYCIEVQREYADNKSKYKFTNIGLFQAAYFAFIKQQDWKYSFAC
jgi:hypothetical protein